MHRKNVVSEADRFLLQSSSNGNQRKWVYDNKYIKADIEQHIRNGGFCISNPSTLKWWS